MSHYDKVISIMSQTKWHHVSLNIAYRYWNERVYRKESGLSTLSGYVIRQVPWNSQTAMQWLEDIE